MNEATMLLKKQLPSVKKLLRRKTLEREVRASVRPRVDHSRSRMDHSRPGVDPSRAMGGSQQGHGGSQQGHGSPQSRLSLSKEEWSY